MTQPSSHYDLLSVGRDAAPDALRLAYRRAAQRHHPDRQPGPGAQELMAEINEAYAVLSHPARRASYDRWLAARDVRLAAELAAEAARPSPFAATWPWGLVAATVMVTVATVAGVLYHTSLPSLVLAAHQSARR